MCCRPGLIIVSPALRGGAWILPNLNTMPCSNCCTTRTERPTVTTPATASITNMIRMAVITVNNPFSGSTRLLCRALGLAGLCQPSFYYHG